MITKLRLENFKNFQSAELALGPLTLLVGTNASGKSNLRDAFRFLHGVGRGYTIEEIIGSKFEGGEPLWGGMRGGVREVAFQGMPTFVLELSYTVDYKKRDLRVLVIPEHFSQDQYILKPIIQAVLAVVGKS
jgi:AAA15 family ATPase/GTPase